MSKLLNDNFIKQVEGMSRTRKQMEIECFYEGIYDFYKSELGEKHPDTLTALAALADSYSYLGEHKKAYKLQYIVYAERVEILGEKHPDTLMALGNLIDTSIILDETNEH